MTTQSKSRFGAVEYDDELLTGIKVYGIDAMYPTRTDKASLAKKDVYWAALALQFNEKMRSDFTWQQLHRRGWEKEKAMVKVWRDMIRDPQRNKDANGLPIILATDDPWLQFWSPRPAFQKVPGSTSTSPLTASELHQLTAETLTAENDGYEDEVENDVLVLETPPPAQRNKISEPALLSQLIKTATQQEKTAIAQEKTALMLEKIAGAFQTIGTAMEKSAKAMEKSAGDSSETMAGFKNLCDSTAQMMDQAASVMSEELKALSQGNQLIHAQTVWFRSGSMEQQ